MFNKIVNLIPINIRNIVPQKVRDEINNKLNYANIIMQKFKFKLNRKQMIEERFQRAINLEYTRYCEIMNSGGGKISKLPDKADLLILPRLVLSVTNRCSLRCKDCNALIPYFKNKRDISVEEMITNIDRIFSLVDYCINVEVIGGEPFLYKDLRTILEYLTGMPQIYFIEITTNGTVLPADDIIDVLRNDKIYISLSDYEAVNESKKMNFRTCMTENAIKFQILDMDSWTDSGNIEKRNRKVNELKWQYYNCHARMNCKTFWNGKLFACGRAPAIYELCSLTSDSSYFDFEDVSMSDDKSMIKKKLKEFYLSEYAECCDYCDYALWPVKNIKGGVQL